MLLTTWHGAYLIAKPSAVFCVRLAICDTLTGAFRLIRYNLIRHFNTTTFAVLCKDVLGDLQIKHD